MYVVRDVCLGEEEFRRRAGGALLFFVCLSWKCVFLLLLSFCSLSLDPKKPSLNVVCCVGFLFLAVARKGRLFLLQNQRSPEISTAPDGAPAGGFRPKEDPPNPPSIKSQPSPHPPTAHPKPNFRTAPPSSPPTPLRPTSRRGCPFAIRRRRFRTPGEVPLSPFVNNPPFAPPDEMFRPRAEGGTMNTSPLGRGGGGERRGGGGERGECARVVSKVGGRREGGRGKAAL